MGDRRRTAKPCFQDLEAPRARIDAVLAEHASVRQLFEHEWLHLVALEGTAAYAREGRRWRPIEA